MNSVFLPRGVTGRQICGAVEVYTHNRRTMMSLSSHLQELRKKHQTLSDDVEVMQRNPATDDLEIAQLKKQKLHLKEEISRLSAQ